MKKLREIKFEELTPEQKISMVTCAQFDPWNRNPEGDEFIYNCIRNRCLGMVWVYPETPDFGDIMKKIHEIADYPLLVITDAESGMGEYLIGNQVSIGMTDSEELSYEFGKVTAVTAHNMGYNVVCNPLLDMVKGESICSAHKRTLGNDKHRVSQLAAAMARGMHDGGVLTVGKHYPSAETKGLIDSHMAETCSLLTEEELVEENLYPYFQLMKEDLLDGIMTDHCRLPNIDPDYPASLSKKVIGIIRDRGFDGFAITDGLSMMGIVAKFGDTDSKGLAVEQGNDIALVGGRNYEKMWNCVYGAYKKGILSDERLDAATKKVLEAQHKVMQLQPKYTELTQADKDAIEQIHKDAVFAKTDKETGEYLSRDGKHLFVVLVPNEAQINEKQLAIDTFSTSWYDPAKVMARVKELFPNSDVHPIRQFPIPTDNSNTLHKAVNYEDVVLITFMEGKAYAGREEFTPPFISLVEAMQVSGMVSAHVHFGTPYAMKALPHIPTVLLGTSSQKGVMATLEVLAGNYPAKGKLVSDFQFK